MQNKSKVPVGYISVKEAIELIKRDKRDDATVDLSFMARNFHWISLNHTFNIPLMKHVNGRAVSAGRTGVLIDNPLDLEMFKQAIRDAYRDRTKREINEEPVRHVTTARGGETGTSKSGNPEDNDSGRAKYGDDIPVNTISQTLTGAGV